MSIVTERQFGQALTVSAQQRSSEIANIVYSARPLTRILRENGQINPETATGPEFRWPVQYDTLKAQWYRGYDYLAITPKELVNSAYMPWTNMVAMFSLNGDELRYNRGEAEIINLIQLYLRDAEEACRQSFEEGLVGNGTLDAGRQIIGLGAAVPTVPNTGTYAGINRANVARWRTTYYDIQGGDIPGFATWDTTTALPIISQISLARSRNGRYPDLWIVSADNWRAVESSFVAHQRIVSDRSTRLGLGGYTYQTGAGPVDIVPAGGIGNVMPSSTLFGLDTRSFEVREFAGRAFVPFHTGSGVRPINQDAIAQGIAWSGQFIMTNPLSNVRVYTGA